MMLKAVWIGACLEACCVLQAQIPPGIDIPPIKEDPPVVELPPDIEEPSEFFLRGDSNEDKTVNIGDPIHILSYLFTGSVTPGCLKAADTNDDGTVNIGDPISLLTFLFSGGPDPQSPLGDCGVDLSTDGLSCNSYNPCSLETLPASNWYTVKPNGTACPREPCFDLTASEVADPTAQVLLTDVNLEHFFSSVALPPDAIPTVTAAILDGRREAGGFLQEGPSFGGQRGRTLVVLFSRIANMFFKDLVVTELKATGKLVELPRGGFALPILVRVENQGRKDVDERFVVDLRARDLAEPLAVWAAGPLASAESVALTATVRFERVLPGADLTLTATADVTNVVEEQSEDNNTLSRRTTPPRR